MFAANELMAARYQMALSLGFHIVLSCLGVALPAMIYVLHRRGLREGDNDCLVLAKKWAKVSAVLFAVGAVSGTILSFEMGLLWPGLMEDYGDVIGLPFALEGIAFFVEAIFMGIYLYGWDRLKPEVHLRTLIPMILSGIFGSFCILTVNAWMNSPTGFDVAPDGSIINIDPLAAMLGPAVWTQFPHMFVATYVVTGFLVSSVYAVGILKGRNDRRHRLGFVVPFSFATVGALMQPIIGHIAGLRLADAQPSKLAAIEAATETETQAPMRLGGLFIDGELVGALEIPYLGSLLSTNSPNGEVPGLDQVPLDEQPPVAIVHLSFQAMVGAGFTMIGISLLFWWMWRRHRAGRGTDPFESRLMMRSAVVAGPLAVLAMELGWITTEVGRQPWIVYGLVRTEDAVTSNSGVWISLAVMCVVYASMAVISTKVIRGMARRWRDAGDDVELPTPYGPAENADRMNQSGEVTT